MRRYSAVCLLALLSTACRPYPERGVADPPQAAYRGPLASSLQVEPMGDSVRFVLQVTNASEAPLTLNFSSGQSYDFAVREGGETLWTWSADRSFMQALRSETLAPGQTHRLSEVWRVPAAQRGRALTAVARMTSTNHPVEQTAEFRVP
jgi:hypothetical protein